MTTKEFVEKMATDEELAKKMSVCTKQEEAYEAAKEAGLTDDYDTFVEFMTALNEQLSEELSDDELENAAGGVSAKQIISGVTSILNLAGSIVKLVAAAS